MMTTTQTWKLAVGTLTVHAEGDVSMHDFFEIAQRKNPKRAFLFVSKVLGRHIPVKPEILRASYQTLALKIPADLPGPVLFIGMAETAVGLAAGVFQESLKQYPQSVLLTSTRHPVPGELLCEFKEEHSHATDHLIYWPADPALKLQAQQAKTIVLVDDEATTGKTFINLYTALKNAYEFAFQSMVTVTLTDWSENAVSSRVDVQVHQVALMKGTWHWAADPDATLPEMPAVNVTAKGQAVLRETQEWGRLGTADAHSNFGQHCVVNPGEKTLVLGSGEFVWPPFMLAERLSNEGADVVFSSTTRSPIALGHAIKSALHFCDNYGLGIPNYAYNVAHLHFDRIILCCETQPTDIDAELLTSLRNIAKNVEIVHV